MIALHDGIPPMRPRVVAARCPSPGLPEPFAPNTRWWHLDSSNGFSRRCVTGPIIAAGRPIDDPFSMLLEYCGIPATADQVARATAFHYFDLTPIGVAGLGHDRLSAMDVLACSVMVHQLQVRWLEWLYDVGLDEINDWASVLPRDVDLWDTDGLLDPHLTQLTAFSEHAPLNLVTKLAFRLRPRLVPLYDVSTERRYRSRLGMRGEVNWPDILRCIRQDMVENRSDLEVLTAALHEEIHRAQSRSYSDAWSFDQEEGGAPPSGLLLKSPDLRSPLALPSPVRIFDMILFIDDKRFKMRKAAARRRSPDGREDHQGQHPGAHG